MASGGPAQLPSLKDVCCNEFPGLARLRGEAVFSPQTKISLTPLFRSCAFDFV